MRFFISLGFKIEKKRNMSRRKSIIIAIESVMLAGALGLGSWWYVHNNVVRFVEKEFEDGSSYHGEWLAGRMHGAGIYKSADGEIYEGSFMDGRRSGHGKIIKSDGSSYDGGWEDDLYHGEGKYVSPKGNVYEGGWKHGSLPEGRLKTDDWTYEGEFHSMSPDGAGVTEYNDGRVYAGYWNKGYKQGLGRLMYPDGKMDFGFWDQGALMRSGEKKFRTGEKVYGLDVSRHQGTWRWEELALYADRKGEVFTSGAKAGHELQPPLFIVMKATEGADLVDPKYADNVAQAREGRIIKGAYHFMTTLSDIDGQISNFIENAVIEEGDFPPVLDIETPHSRVSELGEDTVREMALKWLRAVEDHYGVKPLIYTNDLFRKTYLDTPEFRYYDFWLARYSKKRPESGNWLLWQFTQTGRPRGIAVPADINIFDGTYPEFRSYIDKAWKKD